MNKLNLIDEQTSPLFRIMSVYNPEDSKRKSFANNICAFHIGGGKILTVSHNLRSEAGVVNSIDESIFQPEIAVKIDSTNPLHQVYRLDAESNIRYLAAGGDNKALSGFLKQINFDTRWITLYERKICRPYLILHFKNGDFYDDPSLTLLFSPSTSFHEPAVNRHTFLIELELEHAYYGDDIAAYRIVNTDQRIIDRLPVIEPDFEIREAGDSFFCLQSAPGGYLGRLMNTATIEGFLDHHGFFNDRIGGHYVFEGLRYLIRGYFRFGSSGAPYLYYDGKKFKATAIQSEASPIQLSIGNNREGNFQYVNAIATPLQNIRSGLNS